MERNSAENGTTAGQERYVDLTSVGETFMF